MYEINICEALNLLINVLIIYYINIMLVISFMFWSIAKAGWYTQYFPSELFHHKIVF